MIEDDVLRFGDLSFGNCPHCKESTTFFPTKLKQVYECELCDKKVRQYKNGKVHWFKMGEDLSVYSIPAKK